MDHRNKPSPQMYLAHHGIKGQRWGIRRFQREDGSLTFAGRKRYNDDTSDVKKRAEKTNRDYNPAAMNSKTKKSNHRLKLEKIYLEKGLTQKDAELQAYKREKTEKALAIVGGLTIAAAVAYVAYKYHDKTVDKVIQPGTLLQNISRDDTLGVRDAFYSSRTQMDNTKYRGIYGSSIQAMGGKVYEKKIGVNSALKIASETRARDALADLVKNDSTYAQTLKTHLQSCVGRYGNSTQNEVIRRGLDSLKNGKVDSKVYEALNLSLVDHGYDAIIDTNDKKYSGYKTSSPVIVLNAAKTAVQSVREVEGSEIQKAALKGYLDIAVKDIVPKAGVAAGVTALMTTGTKALENRSDMEIVRRYRAEHPNSKLSYTDILRMEKK